MNIYSLELIVLHIKIAINKTLTSLVMCKALWLFPIDRFYIFQYIVYYIESIIINSQIKFKSFNVELSH
jgi:hypothetical protein